METVWRGERSGRRDPPPPHTHTLMRRAISLSSLQSADWYLDGGDSSCALVRSPAACLSPAGRHPAADKRLKPISRHTLQPERSVWRPSLDFRPFAVRSSRQIVDHLRARCAAPARNWELMIYKSGTYISGSWFKREESLHCAVSNNTPLTYDRGLFLKTTVWYQSFHIRSSI